VNSVSPKRSHLPLAKQAASPNSGLIIERILIKQLVGCKCATEKNYSSSMVEK